MGCEVGTNEVVRWRPTFATLVSFSGRQPPEAPEVAGAEPGSEHLDLGNDDPTHLRQHLTPTRHGDDADPESPDGRLSIDKPSLRSLNSSQWRATDPRATYQYPLQFQKGCIEALEGTRLTESHDSAC